MPFTIHVRSTDIDADQIVNNAVYFEYFEQARLAFLRERGIVGPTWQPGINGRPFALAATEARFLRPVGYPATLSIQVVVREVRTRSFVLAYTATDAADGAIVAEGASAQVWLDRNSRPTALPDPVRAALGATE